MSDLPPSRRDERLAEIEEALTVLCDYAYERGFHEMGFDPVKDVMAEVRSLSQQLDEATCATHCAVCDRPETCDLIQRGTGPCGRNAGVGPAAVKVIEEAKVEAAGLLMRAAAAEAQLVHAPFLCNARFRNLACDRVEGHRGEHCATSNADGTLTWETDAREWPRRESSR